MRRLLHRLIRTLILGIGRLFYPRINLVGGEHLPTGRPVVFVLNHPNGLLDAVVLMQALGRIVPFLAKSTFFANPIARLLMEAFQAVPVFRRRDTGRAGGPTTTPSAANSATFAHAHALLARGGELALFPEGTPNPGPALLPLRSGAARIALGAEAEAGWQLGIQIVPVALYYEDQTRFRSAALAAIGEPFGLEEWVSEDPLNSGIAVRSLTERIRSGLEAVVPHATDPDRIARARKLAAWVSPELPEQYACTLHLLRYSDSQELDALYRQARSFAQRLSRAGIANYWSLEYNRSLGRFAKLSAALVAGLIPAVAGALLSEFPARLVASLTPHLTRGHNQRIGTSRMVVGVGLFGVWWGVVGLITARITGIAQALGLVLAAPALSYAILRWHEQWNELRDILAARRLFKRRQTLAHRLVARRKALVHRITDSR